MALTFKVAVTKLFTDHSLSTR